MPEPEKTVDGKEVELTAAEESIIDQTQARLNALDTEGDEQAEQVEPTPGEKTSTQAEQTDSTPASKTDTAGKETTEEVSLPDAYCRAAEHQGWKPEEIKEFFEATPELAIQTLGKIYESTNKLSNDFANLGRATLKPANKPADSQTVTDVDANKAIDLTALKEEYGADSAVVKTMEAMQARLQTAPAAQPQTVQQTVQQPVQQPVQQIDSQIEIMVNQFFTDPALQPYEEFYGKGKDANALTIQQNNNRYAVLETADNIVVGAQTLGNRMTWEQAMDLAHMTVSASVHEQAARTELKAQIVKRAAGTTLKPAKSKAVVPAKDAATSAADLEAKVEAKLNKIYH